MSGGWQEDLALQNEEDAPVEKKKFVLPRKFEEKVVVVADNGATGYVKCKRRDAWVLVDDGNPYRSRWGNADEIRKDVAHFVEYGRLPKPSSEHW